jgi:hypothetical protein
VSSTCRCCPVGQGPSLSGIYGDVRYRSPACGCRRCRTALSSRSPNLRPGRSGRTIVRAPGSVNAAAERSIVPASRPQGAEVHGEQRPHPEHPAGPMAVVRRIDDHGRQYRGRKDRGHVAGWDPIAELPERATRATPRPHAQKGRSSPPTRRRSPGRGPSTSPRRCTQHPESLPRGTMLGFLSRARWRSRADRPGGAVRYRPVRRCSGRYRRCTALPLGGPLAQPGWAGPVSRLLVTGRRPDIGMHPLLDEGRAHHWRGASCSDGTGSDSARMVLALEPNIVADGTGGPAPEAECRVPCMSAAGGRGGDDNQGNMYFGPIMAPWTRQELINACMVHGRSPFNDETVQALGADPPP